MIRLFLLGALALLFPPGIANAQTAGVQPNDVRFGPGSGGQSAFGINVDGGYGYGGYGYGYGRGHASTAEEGMARGMADVIRARGQASVDVARAATETEQARRAYQENWNYAVSSFVENRAIRDAYRADRFDTKKEKLASYIKTRQFQPLSDVEFYESTGEINWPIGLMHPHDENGRKQVEALFAERAEKGSLEATEYIRLNKLLNDWVNHVGSHKDDFSSSDITEAIRFLRRLQMLIKGDYQ